MSNEVFWYLVERKIQLGKKIPQLEARQKKLAASQSRMTHVVEGVVVLALIGVWMAIWVATPA